MKKGVTILILIFISFSTTAQTNILPASGNVGIGTANPSALLHVYNGQSHFESTSNGVSDISSGTYALMIGPLHTRSSIANTYYGGIAFNHLLNYNSSITYNVAPGAWIGLRQYDLPGSERDYLVFATKPGIGISGAGSDIPIERMAIDPFGNVGIGTTSPTEKLSVNGNIRSKKIIVTQNGWSDYVFNDGYRLRPLTQVANFIKENKHLPDVPTAKEIAKDGIDVGATQAVLLKKIEELTLYIIDIKKENEQTKKVLNLKIKEQQKQIDQLIKVK